MRKARASLFCVSSLLISAAVSSAWSAATDSTSFDPHDFSGVWVKPGYARDPAYLAADRADTRPETTFYPGKLPFTAAGRAAFDANKPTSGPRQVTSEMSDNDPRDGGNPPGLYGELQRSGNGRYMRMVHADDSLIMLLSTSRVWRIIYTDGRPVPEYHPAGPFWYGHSVGHWDGYRVLQRRDFGAFFDGGGRQLEENEMQRPRTTVMAALLLLSWGPMVSAHHGTSGFYDDTKKVPVEGVVKQFVYRNPHAGLLLEVTDENGEKAIMALEMGSPSTLSRMGYHRNRIRAWDHVKALVHVAFANPLAGEAEAAYIQVNGEYVAPQDYRDRDKDTLSKSEIDKITQEK